MMGWVLYHSFHELEDFLNEWLVRKTNSSWRISQLVTKILCFKFSFYEEWARLVSVWQTMELSTRPLCNAIFQKEQLGSAAAIQRATDCMLLVREQTAISLRGLTGPIMIKEYLLIFIPRWKFISTFNTSVMRCSEMVFWIDKIRLEIFIREVYALTFGGTATSTSKEPLAELIDQEHDIDIINTRAPSQ